MIRAQVSWWPGNVSVGGTHVHHLVWGICAMMIFGYIGVVHQPDSPWREIVTVFFAIGMGLTLDEFALWVELKDVYWEKEGRKSIDAMIIAGCLAGLLAVGFSSWLKLADDVGDTVFAAVGFWGLVGILLALVCAAKEKFWSALGSLFIWPIGRSAPTGSRSRTRCGRTASIASGECGSRASATRPPARIRRRPRRMPLPVRRPAGARSRRRSRPASGNRDRQQCAEDAGELGAGETATTATAGGI